MSLASIIDSTATVRLDSVELRLWFCLDSYADWASFIQYVGEMFRKSNTSYPLIRTRKLRTFLIALRPNPGQKEKIKLNFYFQTSLWCLKRFYEGLMNVSKSFDPINQGLVIAKLETYGINRILPERLPNYLTNRRRFQEKHDFIYIFDQRISNKNVQNKESFFSRISKVLFCEISYCKQESSIVS